jgi:hypothetical protein
MPNYHRRNAKEKEFAKHRHEDLASDDSEERKHSLGAYNSYRFPQYHDGCL